MAERADLQKALITVCDVEAAGACWSGILEWVAENEGRIQGDPSEYPDNEYIQRAEGSGYGYGYGDGDGSGSGYGYGYGSGSGYG